MPTLFESFKRIVSGQPVFRPEEGDGGYTPPNEHKQSEQTPALFGHAEVHRADGKVAPIVLINEVDCHIHGDRMDMSVVVQNRHTSPVFVDRINILGDTWRLSRDMAPGEEHEFMFYKGGERPKQTHMTKAELRYRDVTGDYFSSTHYVEYDELQDGKLVVERLRFLPPIKDA